jgi:hypothetical protein
LRAGYQRFSSFDHQISGDLPRWGCLIGAAWPHLWPTDCLCCRNGRFEQAAKPDQGEGDHVQAEHCARIVVAAQLELTQSAPLFAPVKDLLDTAASSIDSA